jgi:hypothetical protein
MTRFISHVQQGKRTYPGEFLAESLFTYLDCLRATPKELVEFFRLLLPLLHWSHVEGVPWKGKAQEAFDELQDEIFHEVAESGKLSLQSGRFVVEANSPRGKACFAIFQLLLEGKLSKIRNCLQCKAYFYARFKVQMFCTKKCQEANYHSPDWRKKNRERNRKHQKEYRGRLFGSKRKRN